MMVNGRYVRTGNVTVDRAHGFTDEEPSPQVRIVAAEAKPKEKGLITWVKDWWSDQRNGRPVESENASVNRQGRRVGPTDDELPQAIAEAVRVRREAGEPHFVYRTSSKEKPERCAACGNKDCFVWRNGWVCRSCAQPAGVQAIPKEKAPRSGGRAELDWDDRTAPMVNSNLQSNPFCDYGGGGDIWWRHG